MQIQQTMNGYIRINLRLISLQLINSKQQTTGWLERKVDFKTN